MTADIGLIGLAVMGQNLVLNMNDHGYTVAVFNRSNHKTDAFLQGPATGTNIVGTTTIEGLVDTLVSPRRIMLMVKAGQAVDAVIDQLVPLLDEGDIIIDGGNSRWKPLASFSSGPACRAAKKGRASDHRSCREAHRRRGSTSRTYCNRSLPRCPMVRLAVTGWVQTELDTT